MEPPGDDGLAVSDPGSQGRQVVVVLYDGQVLGDGERLHVAEHGGVLEGKLVVAEARVEVVGLSQLVGAEAQKERGGELGGQLCR